LEGVNVVVDGLDNAETRIVVNFACVKNRIPFIYGGVSRLRGMITTIIPRKTPCLSCFYPDGPQGGTGLGVLGPIPSLIANLQVLEVIKILIGEEPAFLGRLLRFNGNDMQFRFYEIKRNENCKVCSKEE
jgi:molybdopterin/thiamine biosynthesis adenylyltransferase